MHKSNTIYNKFVCKLVNYFALKGLKQKFENISWPELNENRMGMCLDQLQVGHLWRLKVRVLYLLFCVSLAVLSDTYVIQPADMALLTLNLQKWPTCSWSQHIPIDLFYIYYICTFFRFLSQNWMIRDQQDTGMCRHQHQVGHLWRLNVAQYFLTLDTLTLKMADLH